MKSLMEILNSPETSTTSPIPNQYNVAVSDPVLENANVEVPTPDYMYEPGMVGYENEEIQEDTYKFAITGVLPLSGRTRILDVGAGRGDLYHYIKKTLPSLDVIYTGIEQNELLSKIGNEKFSDDSRARIYTDDFLTFNHDRVVNNKEGEDTLDTYDHIFLIGTLNLFYGWATDDWSHIEAMINKTLDLAKYSVTFILLHDNGGFDLYRSFPIPNVTDMVLKFNCSFSIEFDNETDIYKLTLKKF